MLALACHEAVQDGHVLAAGDTHPLDAEDRYVAEKAPEAVLVNDRLLQKPVSRAARDELVEFGVQLEELDAVQLIEAIGQQCGMRLPQPLGARLVQPE